MTTLIPSALDLRHALTWIGLVVGVAVVMWAYYRFLAYLEDRLAEPPPAPPLAFPPRVERRTHHVAVDHEIRRQFYARMAVNWPTLTPQERADWLAEHETADQIAPWRHTGTGITADDAVRRVQLDLASRMGQKP